MSKMNPPLRMKKVVVGYKSIRDAKGSSDQYEVTTNAGATEASVTDSSGTLIGFVTGDGLKDVLTKVKAGLKSLGVKFPISQPASVPFTWEEALIEFSAEPASGDFDLLYDGDTVGTIAYDDTAADMQALLRDIDGLDQVTVDGDFTAGFTVTFVGVPEPAALSEDNNTLEDAGTNPVTITIS